MTSKWPPSIALHCGRRETHQFPLLSSLSYTLLIKANEGFDSQGQGSKLDVGEARNLKGGIGSLFDTCVNTMGGGRIAHHIWR